MKIRVELADENTIKTYPQLSTDYAHGILCIQFRADGDVLDMRNGNPVKCATKPLPIGSTVLLTQKEKSDS